MGIIYDEVQSSFILQTKHSTYIMKILKEKYLSHIYWGSKIELPVVEEMELASGRGSFHANPDEDDSFSLDTRPIEYPAYGNTDLRMPAYMIQLENGSRITDLTYESYEIVKGKPVLQGLPAVYTESKDEAETLLITLSDRLIGLKVVLSYTVFKEYDAIIRSVKFLNLGETNLRLHRALSMAVDFDHFDYDLVTLSGSWGRERHIVKRSLVNGIQSIESRRGASGHSENPFMALSEKKATENTGQVYGFSLVYSGSFLAGVEVEQYKTARVVMGINPFDFEWLLEEGEEFQTPEVVMVYSKKGFGEMSRTYHRLYRNRLARGKYKNAERPILINNWEATYFNFTEQKLKDIAKEAAQLGMELLVLDDGWFGKRNTDNSSLGDWFVNREKLPGGLKILSEEINGYGMGFGLWFEPEMVSPDSDLYRAHPDWCLHVPDRSKSLGRKQAILDYSREDVQEAIITMLSEVLSTANISYVKWDMNRNMSEIGSALLPANRQKETAHRYILGVYRVMEVLTNKFPEVLFESCSGGGGRFDPGILYYMPQGWTSDDTDGVERLKIQYGTSLVYPASSMTAHVSAVPNHQTGRSTSLEFRGHVAMAGNFGYELDVTKLSDEEKQEVKEQIALYKELRQLVQYGDFYRLLSPFEGNITGWMYVSEDKREAAVFFYLVHYTANDRLYRFPLNGLAKEYTYSVNGKTSVTGTQLMNFGLQLPRGFGWGDFKSVLFLLKAEE
ncbi:alpha-galactosidase [Anaerocolumna cellulosilytica]|uniref:Alpha-galactosidase n=1 Tax=Anaerocolumna cellulosilytica TaxID=433286 RepID=A0A6S6R3D3_9FIRM|nr:alpha-galactosidase [Anaerocolumna cellulosilytica]MBB5196746.1 alpha-galactosidase [Anaerocolumna cellulosilytica]BCJ95859.1 alpha-galactosidase [Anaerocolumna cellulosilytica]